MSDLTLQKAIEIPTAMEIASKAVRKFTGTGLITGTDRNGLLLFLLPAQFLIIFIQYTFTD